jgi:hypothetical protein
MKYVNWIYGRAILVYCCVKDSAGLSESAYVGRKGVREEQEVAGRTVL